MAKASKKKEVVAAEPVEVKKEVKKKAAAKKPAAAKAASVKPAKSAVSKKNENQNAYLVIDYPVETEHIYGNHYAIRIGASPDGYVELSFNDGEWIPCRYADGYWWFDWVYFTPGNYKLASRMIGSNGEVVKSTGTRKCKVC
ncbi:MAG: hypothetical protein FWC57_04320 [Endomicrobia bacterium]|nr:hypothetical protein [Endomicrobiia bacterium]